MIEPIEPIQHRDRPPDRRRSGADPSGADPSAPARVIVEDHSGDDRFVRSILRRLVDDPADIDDLAQDTWLATIQQSGASLYARRAWMGTVAKNFAYQASRGSARRKRRERAAAIPESDVSTRVDEDTTRQVRAALDGLEARYRIVLWHRFYDDLPPTMIADRLRISVETVRTRLKRGLVAFHARLISARADSSR